MRGDRAPLRALSPADLERLLLRLGEARGARGFSLDEAAELASWANAARVMTAIVDLIIAGRVRVDVRDGGVTVGAAVPRLRHER